MAFARSFLRLSFAVVLAALGSALWAADTGQIQTELKRIEILNRGLDTGGLSEILASALPCPLIHSQYLAEKIAALEPELRELEQAKRDFGLKFARALDDLAAQLQKRAESKDRASQATILLDLAAWVKAAPGYGNYILFSRCESLATVPLAYLTADLDYSLTSVAYLRSRIVPAAMERAFRVAVLNDEAGKLFIGALSETDSVEDEQMQVAWNTGWNAMAGWFNSKGVTISYWRRDALPEELAFFLDDEHTPEPFTTVNLWGLKRHNTLIFGYRDVQVRNVDEFMLYREKVGSFPTQPPRWWKPNPTNSSDTALRAAFQEASSHLRRENGQPFGYSVAAIVYQQVTEGQFLDRETQYCGLGQTQKRPEAGKP
jgi:hypothetical protein